MSKFTDVVKEETPRLIVMFRMDEANGETFGWKLVCPTAVPVVHMVGGIVAAQSYLCHSSCVLEECDEVLFVMAWDAQKRDFDYFMHPSIPITPLLGMLDMIKSSIEAGIAVKRNVSNSAILGPDGNPIRGGG